MTERDLHEVERIEVLSHSSPWPIAIYRRDLESNPIAAYFVARLAHDGAPPETVGVGGMWVQLDEAHITTIAVTPTARRMGVGRCLLCHMMRHALNEGAVDVTLEVRVSNLAAFRLYRQTGFREVGRRRCYYSDTGEDALVMTARLYDDDGARRFRRSCGDGG